MPLAIKEYYPNNCILAIWKMDEPVDELLQLISLDDVNVKIVDSYKLEKRKKEWLCVRILVKEILGKEVLINYLENGKPYFFNDTFSISISHSKDYVAVIICDSTKVGIDIEYISNRVDKIKMRFLSDAELEVIPSGENYHKQLLAYWCAKESLIKISGRREIEFKTQLKIHPFDYCGNGFFVSEIIDDDFAGKYMMNYFEFDGYIIVWGCES